MARARTPTIIDIAAEAGVSKSAVSRALLGQGDVSPENRQRIEAAATRLGYVANAMARSLASSSTRTIGVVLRDVRKPYYSYLQAAMQSRAEELDYRIVTTTNAGKPEVTDALREIRNLISLQVEGLIIAPARLPTGDFTPFLGRVPIVVAGRRETAVGVSSVAADDAHGAAALVEHLQELHHRRVAVALVDAGYSQRYHDRGTAMVRAAEAAGMAVTVLPTSRDLDTAAAVESGFTALTDAGTTAIMCPNDGAALDVLEILRTRGGDVAERYSVTGFDGYGPTAVPYIGLTTYRAPQEEVGRAAVDLLINGIEGRADDDRFISLRGRLVPGRTARAAPAG